MASTNEFTSKVENQKSSCARSDSFAAISRAFHGEKATVLRSQLAAIKFQEKETVQRMIRRITNHNIIVSC
jgi:hypothetical protein